MKRPVLPAPSPDPDPTARANALVPGVVGAIVGELAARADSWINAMTGLGGARDKIAATRAGTVVQRLTDPELTAMYAQEDMSAKLVDTYPREAMREGFEIGGLGDGKRKRPESREAFAPAVPEDDPEADTDPEAPPTVEQGEERIPPFSRKREDAREPEQTPETEVMNFLKPWNLTEVVTEAAIWGRLYGGAAIYLADGKPALTDRSKPRVEGDPIAYLRVIDRRFLNPSGRSPTDYDEQGRPVLYDITNGEGKPMMSGVHRSRFVWFGGARTDAETRIRLEGWDYSVLQRAFNALRNDGIFWASALQLVTEASVGVTKIKGFYSMVAGKQKERLQERIQLTAMARNMSRSMILDAEGEDYERVQTTFAGVSDLNGASIERVAAAGEIPVTVLFGRAPAGLNATGDSDLRWFFARVQAYRKQELAKRILELVRAILAMPGAPRGVDLDALEIRWPNLWRPSAKEQAEIYTATAAADATYRDMGVLMTEEIALSRFADDGFSQDTEIDRKLREEALEGAGDAMAGALPPLEGDPAAAGAQTPPTLGSEETRNAEEEENGDEANKDPNAAPKVPAVPAGVAEGDNGGAGVLPGGAPAPIRPVPARPVTSGPSTAGGDAGNIQTQALNGTQVSSMIDIVSKVAAKEISRESGAKALEIAFQLSAVDALALLGPEDFVQVKPEPAFNPFGGGGGKFGDKGKPGKGAPPFGKGAPGAEPGAPPAKKAKKPGGAPPFGV